MNPNSIISSLLRVTSYNPFELKKEDADFLEKLKDKAELLEKHSSAASVKFLRLIFTLKDIYLDILNLPKTEDPTCKYLFKLLNESLISLKNNDINRIRKTLAAAEKEKSLSECEKELPAGDFIGKLKYDSIYSRLVKSISITEEIAELLTEDKK